MPSATSYFENILKENPQWAAVTLGPLHFLGDPVRHWSFGQAVSTHEWEDEKRAYFFDVALELQCSMFIDVGSNYGIYAADAAHRDQFSEIWAFEPDRQNLYFLRHNLAANGCLDNVRVYADALSDTDGLADFFAAANSVRSSLTSNQDTAESTVTLVTTRRLDALYTGKRQRIALKIDVEGTELSALRGMERLLRNNECLLQIESWNASTVTEFLASCGYEEFQQIEPEPDHYYRKIGMTAPVSVEERLHMVLRKAEVLNAQVRENRETGWKLGKWLGHVQNTLNALDERARQTSEKLCSGEVAQQEALASYAMDWNTQVSALGGELGVFKSRLDALERACTSLEGECTQEMATLGENVHALRTELDACAKNHAALARECAQEIDRLTQDVCALRVREHTQNVEEMVQQHQEMQSAIAGQAVFQEQMQKALLDALSSQALAIFAKASSSRWRRLCRKLRSPLFRPVAFLQRYNLVDTEFYWAQYPEMTSRAVSAEKHYCLVGAAEGKNPSLDFNTREYLVQHPDVCLDGMNPLVHAGLAKSLVHKE